MRKPLNKARVCRLAAPLAWLLWLTACGKVGDPLPPLIQIPAPVSDLAALQFGQQVNLSWTLPKLNTNGSTATTLVALEVFRLKLPPQSPLPPKLEFSQAAVRLAVLPQAAPPPPTRPDKIAFVDRLQDLAGSEILQYDLIYAVKAINQKKQDAGFSNLVRLRMVSLPTPPGGLKDSLAEDSIDLSWERPSQSFDKTPWSGETMYRVYRGSGGPSGAELLTQEPVTSTHFKDASITLDKSYVYTVRAVVSTPAGLLESYDSQPLNVINRDVYPPKAPLELTAISNGNSVSLVWVPDTEPDLAGYHVYRRVEGETERRLTEKVITTTSFLDRAVEKGKLLTYRVTAVDTHGNESAFSEAASERVE